MLETDQMNHKEKETTVNPHVDGQLQTGEQTAAFC